MKIYKVKVNGKIYEVELESIEENTQEIQSPKNETRPSTNKGHAIKSPMQGTIQSILVKVGQKVKAGDSILILEAMKLENDITADKDYVIEEILVKVGDTVENNQALVKVS